MSRRRISLASQARHRPAINRAADAEEGLGRHLHRLGDRRWRIEVTRRGMRASSAVRLVARPQRASPRPLAVGEKVTPGPTAVDRRRASCRSRSRRAKVEEEKTAIGADSRLLRFRAAIPATSSGAALNRKEAGGPGKTTPTRRGRQSRRCLPTITREDGLRPARPFFAARSLPAFGRRGADGGCDRGA